MDGIKSFIRDHKCREICKRMRLDKACPLDVETIGVPFKDDEDSDSAQAAPPLPSPKKKGGRKKREETKVQEGAELGGAAGGESNMCALRSGRHIAKPKPKPVAVKKTKGKEMVSTDPEIISIDSGSEDEAEISAKPMEIKLEDDGGIRDMDLSA